MGIFSSLFGHKKTPEEIRQEERKALTEKANQGDISAMMALGERYCRGEKVEGKTLEQVREAGVNWYKRAAGLGNAEAMWRIARMYDPHLAPNLRDDEALAIVWYKKASEAGYKKAHTDVGKRLLKNKDYAGARKYFEMGVDKGDSEAFVQLGRLCESGRGGEKNLERAMRLYEGAAELDSAFAHLYLGDMYYFGKGTEINYEKAAEHYKEGSRRNVSAAQAMLRLMMLCKQTPLVGTDEEAFRYLLRLSDGFSPDRAGYIIGTFFETGFCVDVNLAKAMEYYEMSAKAGYRPAMVKVCELECKVWDGHEESDLEKMHFWAEKLMQE